MLAINRRLSIPIGVSLFGKQVRAFWFLIVLIALHLGLAMSLNPRELNFFFDIRVLGSMLAAMLLLFLLLTLKLAVLVVLRRLERPTITLYRFFRMHRLWLVRSVILLALAIPCYRAFLAIKVAISSFVPYYADPALAALDNLLFLGHEPWAVTHALLGPWTSQIDTIYYQWFVVTFVALVWSASSRNRVFQMQATFAHVLTWIVLGNILALSLSSVGPIFYADFYRSDRFAPLVSALPPGLDTLIARDYLLNAYGELSLGSGISAAPSLHVGEAMLIYVMVRDQLPRFRWFAAAYVAVIFIGSIHLGWHYAIDGLISIALVPLLWRAARLLSTQSGNSLGLRLSS